VKVQNITIPYEIQREHRAKVKEITVSVRATENIGVSRGG
jgi:hypothetical protein